MKTKIVKHQNINGRPLQVRRLSIVVALALFGSVANAATEFHPRTLVSASYIDNLTLAADNDPAKESGFVLQANPGFTFLQRAPRFSSSLEYTMQNVYFPSESDRNSTFHQGEAGLAAELLSTYLFFDGAASYSQQVVDPKLPTNNNNLFEVANQTDALAAHATAALRHEFDAVRMDARYTRGLVDYKRIENGTQLQDADTQSYGAILGSADELAVLSWEGRYEMQEAEYKDSPKYKFETASAELGLLFGKSLRLIGRSGAESDPAEDPTKGGLDNKTWEAGFRYTPGVRTRVEGFYGDRFYGKSYSALIHHEARRARWDLSYNEGPLTQAQEMILRPIAAESAPQSTVNPGSVQFARETSAVFLRKTFEARVHLDGQRTSIDLYGTDYRREYLKAVTGGEEHMKGGSVSVTRRFSGRTDFIVSTRLEDSDLRDGGSYRDLDFGMEFRHRLTDKLRTGVAVRRVDRTGIADYTANWITASITGEF